MWRTMPLPCRVMSVRRPAMLHDGASSPPHWQVVKTPLDRKSTRLNSSHGYISYAVFCLKKKTHVVADDHLPELLLHGGDAALAPDLAARALAPLDDLQPRAPTRLETTLRSWHSHPRHPHL